MRSREFDSPRGLMAKNKKKVDHTPVEKDDGTRWIVTRNGAQVYPGSGLVKREALRLATGLVEPAEVEQVA